MFGVTRSVLGRAAATLDRAAAQAARLQSARARRGSSESLSHEERLGVLASIRDAYGAPELFGDPDAFFTPPPPLHPKLARVRSLPGGGSVLDASWPSSSQPFLAGVTRKYLAHERNQTAYARLYLAARPRAALVLIHGYLGGQWAIEERAWPISWLYGGGLDLALAVLPFHALRARTDRSGPPPFPGADPRMTNEGFRQAVYDLRTLIRFLRARGAPSVGAMGMSLGGYTTALLATVERDLSFAVPMIPLASVADFARDQGRLGNGEQARLQHPALEAANRVVSPLARPALVPSDRVVILAAESDRITPRSHAERLSRHFGADIIRFPGGHLLQFGRNKAFHEVARRLSWRG